MLGAACSQMLEVSGHRRDEPHVRGDRLHEHRRHFMPEVFEHLVDRSGVVVRDDDRVAYGAFGDTGGSGEPERGNATSGLHEQRVEVPVVAAGELDHLRAAGRAAGKADSGHRRFGS